MVHGSTLAVAIVHRVLPTLVAVGMYHRPTDAHMDMDSISVCTESFAKSLVEVVDKLLPHYQWSLVLLEIDHYPVNRNGFKHS